MKEPPYIMYKDDETKKLKPECGIENLIGYCIDMAKAIEKELRDVKFNVCIRADGVYGNQEENGSWSGMLGQLVRQVDTIKTMFAPSVHYFLNTHVVLLSFLRDNE